jgi:hypothetical protein
VSSATRTGSRTLITVNVVSSRTRDVRSAIAASSTRRRRQERFAVPLDDAVHVEAQTA